MLLRSGRYRLDERERLERIRTVYSLAWVRLCSLSSGRTVKAALSSLCSGMFWFSCLLGGSSLVGSIERQEGRKAGYTSIHSLEATLAGSPSKQQGGFLFFFESLPL